MSSRNKKHRVKALWSSLTDTYCINRTWAFQSCRQIALRSKRAHLHHIKRPPGLLSSGGKKKKRNLFLLFHPFVVGFRFWWEERCCETSICSIVWHNGRFVTARRPPHERHYTIWVLCMAIMIKALLQDAPCGANTFPLNAFAYCKATKLLHRQKFIAQ